MRNRLVWFAALTAGCSAIAGGGGDRPWECQIIDGDDFCAEVSAPGEMLRCAIPEGETVGMCTACSPEVCNGIDDDCDGVVDNALDDDGDGYYLCPTGPAPHDCDDQRLDVHPTRAGQVPVPDICDGLDNDCDPATDDGSADCDPATQDCIPSQGCVDINCSTRANLCSADEFCDMAAVPPTCEPRDMTCFNPAVRFRCPDGQVCNPANAECVEPMPNGSGCETDAQCSSSLCIPIGVIRAPSVDVGGASGICGVSCCTDSECAEGSRCWESGSGAKACVPETVLEQGSGVPAQNVCSTARDCADGCGVDIDDAYHVPSRVSLSCGLLRGRVSCTTTLDCVLRGLGPATQCIDRVCQRTLCFGATDCATGLCVRNECREPCGTTADCGGSGGVCAPSGFRSVGGGRVDYVATCDYSDSEGSGGRTSCNDDGACRDNTCVGPDGTTTPPLTCAATCCSDSTCAGGEQCRPIFVHGRWENHCLPKPMFGRTANGG